MVITNKRIQTGVGFICEKNSLQLTMKCHLSPLKGTTFLLYVDLALFPLFDTLTLLVYAVYIPKFEKACYS